MILNQKWSLGVVYSLVDKMRDMIYSMSLILRITVIAYCSAGTGNKVSVPVFGRLGLFARQNARIASANAFPFPR